MKKADIFEFFRRLAEGNPDPQTELEFGNTYQLLVAVTLSAQATDVGVNKATRALFEIVKTPQDMLDLGIDGLKDHIKTIGLFNTKAKNVMAMAGFWSSGMAARFRPTGMLWSLCPAWGARRPMWC
jgi:endonuclease-3